MFYRRKLPHWQEEGIPLFVTWNLKGAIVRTQSPDLPAGKAFVAWDRELDKAQFGPVWLQDTRIADAVAETIQAGERERRFYELHAWVIMPNHVHLVILPKVELSVITRWLKGSTAREANLILGRTGQPFWNAESFDHRVRDEEELRRITEYIENNPVKAGFVSSPADWRWSSAVLAGETACRTL